MSQNATISALSVAFLRPLIAAFLAKAGPEWSPTRLGRDAVKDPKKVFLIQDGMQVRPATARKIIAVIDREIPGFSKAFVLKRAGADHE